jgi:hypothetical protein
MYYILKQVTEEFFKYYENYNDFNENKFNNYKYKNINYQKLIQSNLYFEIKKNVYYLQKFNILSLNGGFFLFFYY